MLKITQDRIQQRLVDRDLRRTQMADQLVEVSTSLFLSLLQQQRAEQIADNPVPRGGLEGYLQFLALRLGRFMDFFSHFSRSEKKVRGPAASAELTRQVIFLLSGSPRSPARGRRRLMSSRSPWRRRLRATCLGLTIPATSGSGRPPSGGGGSCSSTMRVSGGTSPYGGGGWRGGGRAAGGWRLLAVVVVFSQDRFCRVL